MAGCAQRAEAEERCEFFHEDAARLRAVAGEPPPDAGLAAWQRRRVSRLTQLEVLNADLEKMVGELEDELRRKREAQKLAARYQGLCAPHAATCLVTCAWCGRARCVACNM